MGIIFILVGLALIILGLWEDEKCD